MQEVVVEEEEGLVEEQQVVVNAKILLQPIRYLDLNRSLSLSDTVTESKARACIEMDRLLHSC